MNYTPNDLENIGFKREFLYGYNREQVNKILSKVCEDYNSLKQDNDELQNEIKIMKETVRHYRTIEESLQHTLIIAQQTSESITSVATNKADDIIREAEINALNIINNANNKVDSIQHEYEVIKKSLDVYKIRSQALLNSTMELLKSPFEE